MKPVEQRRLHDPDNGVLGDCFAACVASVLEISYEETPEFTKVPDGGSWRALLAEFIEPRDLSVIEILRLDPMPEFLQNSWTILTGPSPRDSTIRHCVVGMGDRQVFDPHPDKTGIEDVSSILLFVKRNPQGRIVCRGCGAFVVESVGLIHKFKCGSTQVGSVFSASSECMTGRGER